MKIALLILGVTALLAIGLRWIGRTSGWDEPAPDEHDEHFREITARHVRTARRRFEQYEMN